MGVEGASVLFDTWVHPLVMGLEEHLLTMFREDFEFSDAAGPSHHGGHAPAATGQGGSAPRPPEADSPRSVSAEKKDGPLAWAPAAERELRKIPFFVRGKARRNTEVFAADRGVGEITVDTLYEAKAHYAR
jgi:light-independent protochlorophyllide reductase subunit B